MDEINRKVNQEQCLGWELLSTSVVSGDAFTAATPSTMLSFRRDSQMPYYERICDIETIIRQLETLSDGYIVMERAKAERCDLLVGIFTGVCWVVLLLGGLLFVLLAVAGYVLYAAMVFGVGSGLLVVKKRLSNKGNRKPLQQIESIASKIEQYYAEAGTLRKET